MPRQGAPGSVVRAVLPPGPRTAASYASRIKDVSGRMGGPALGIPFSVGAPR